jgi:phenylpyruvate tautomerase PptA (4-oxalocrotonate tautomerase family)
MFHVVVVALIFFFNIYYTRKKHVVLKQQKIAKGVSSLLSQDTHRKIRMNEKTDIDHSDQEDWGTKKKKRHDKNKKIPRSRAPLFLFFFFNRQ